MKYRLKLSLIWFISVIFTLVAVVYQKSTGPTYPVRGHANIAGKLVKYRLIRSWDLPCTAKVTVIIPDTGVKGEIRFRRYKSYDIWQTASMARRGDTLTGTLPLLPPAGKVMYQVTLSAGDQRILLNEKPAVLRYTGFVPRPILIPHIIFMFLAMLFSTLAGFLAVFRIRGSYLYACLTVITLLIGGLILGPVVQKFAFGEFWTGWPFGHDLTDNKAFVTFIFWIIALVVMKKNRDNRLWPVLAAVILMAVYTIPHSLLGSEIDFTKGNKTEVVK